MELQPIAVEDLLVFRLPTDVRLAPDGRSVVYTERHADAESGRTRTRLVRVREGAGPEPFTSGEHDDRAARFSPDGRRLAFLRTPPPPADGKPVETRLCVIPTDGGEARVLLQARGSFGAPQWSPDGRWLAVAFRHDDELPEDEKAPLSIRVTRLHYKQDGSGYLPRDRFHLYKVDSEAAEPALEPVTDPDGDWDDVEPAWSPDGSRLAFVSNRRPDRDRDVENGDVFVIGAGGGPATQCTHKRGPVAPPRWSPDGRWLFAAGSPGPPGSPVFRLNIELFRVDPSGQAEEVSLTSALDRCVGNLTLDDLWGLDNWDAVPVVTTDGRRVLFSVSDQGATWLGAVDLDAEGNAVGPVARVVDDRSVICYDAAPAANRLALVTTTPTEPGRLELRDLTGGERRELAWPLEGYCGERRIVAPHEIRVETAEGHVVHGWLLLPEGDGPFPMLLDIHGGPCVQFGVGFFHELQTFAARGYAVLYVNPRGSQGYGAAFADAIYQDWGTGPFADVMAAVDHVLARFPLDEERLGVLGGSYGGYLTTWVVGHTHRFKAACVQRTVSSMEAMICNDFGAAWADELGALPWADPELYRRLSPMTYLENVQTPVLVTQGTADQRTPVDQGERLYLMLRLMGKEAELVLFPGGTHDLSRNGKPRQRIERLKVIHEWFDRKLGAGEAG